jgi:YggT family protein
MAVTFLRLLALVVSGAILARVVLSWVAPTSNGPMVAFLYQVTEPILQPIRRLLPPQGGLDLSPMIALLVIGLVSRLLFGL